MNEEILTLVLAYRGGNSAAAEELLTRFNPLLQKYVRLLTTGSYNAMDPDVSRFLFLCGKEDPSQTARLLCYQLKQDGVEAEDLLQEARLALLQAALLTDYIIGRFRALLRNSVFALMKQAPPRALNINIDDLLGHWPAPEDPEWPQELDVAWVAGEWQQHEAFAEFTPEERLFIKRVWLDRVPEETLRVELDLSEWHLNKKKERLKARLARLLNRI